MTRSPADDSSESEASTTTEASDAATVEQDIESLEAQLVSDVASADTLRVELERLEAELTERTADVQRLQAEYVNYRKRVERDREAVRDAAIGGVFLDLLTVIDDIDRADEHGELVGGFRSVADAFTTALTKLGLQRYGTTGEAFDPTIHEALTHGHSSEVTEPTCQQVFQPGYRFGDRVLRPARVAVVEPGD